MGKVIRWLHLSDFHVGSDGYAQKRLFEKIVEHVKEQKNKGFIPDLIFFTGDIANKGLKDEYQVFNTSFLNPLLQVVGGDSWHGRLFCVPGNHEGAHDVRRPPRSRRAGCFVGVCGSIAGGDKT